MTEPVMRERHEAELHEVWARLEQDRRRATRIAGPLWSVASTSTWRALWVLTDRLKAQAPEVWGLFGSEDDLRMEIIDGFEQHGRCALEPLIERLQAAASERWVVEAPIANLRLAADLVEIDTNTVLLRTGDRWDSTRRRDIERFFGVEQVRIGHRYSDDVADRCSDTRHTASILAKRLGPRSAVRERVKTEARFSIAVWTLLSPPTDDGTYEPIWPIATEWFPQPWSHAPGSQLAASGRGERRSGSGSLHPDSTMYEVPEDFRLNAPTRAIAAASTQRSARALLAAAWQLYLAARIPNDRMWSDRLVAVMIARDALCESPGGTSTVERWNAGRDLLGVDESMVAAGWSEDDIEAVNDRVWKLRNIGVHGADSAMLALGFPPSESRAVRHGDPIPGVELSPLAIREAVPPTFAAVRFMAVGLWRRMLQADFDTDVYDSLLTR